MRPRGCSTTSPLASPAPASCFTTWSQPARTRSRRPGPWRRRAEVPARTGAEYLAALSRQRAEVWFAGERVENVVDHPAFTGAARTLASLYDLQYEPELRAEMLYDSPSSGEPVGISFLEPHSADDIVLRRRMIKRWADATL